MRALLLFLMIVPLLQVAHAQTISDCEGAIALCESFYFEEQAPLNTGDIGEFTGACNSGIEWNSVWYTFTVQSAGNLSFILTPNNLDDDYDWGLFDITTGGCAGINLQDGSSPEVSCNAWGTLTPPNGATGISSASGGVSNSGGPGDQFGPPFNADLQVNEGQTYALVVMNWTASTSGYSIDFAESTAALFDAIPPSMQEAVIDCANENIVVVFDEPVVVATAQEIDFVILGPDQVEVASALPNTATELTDTLLLTLDQSIVAPGTYQLIISDASGWVEDPCGNAQADTIDFTVVAPLQVVYDVLPACNGENGSFFLAAVSTTQAFGATIAGQEVVLGQSVILDAGIQNFSIVDASGCVNTMLVEIPNEELSFEVLGCDTITCFNPQVQFQSVVISNVSTLAFQWTTIDGQVVDQLQQNATAAAPGIYSCTVSTVPNGCSVSDDYQVVSSEVYTITNDMLVWPNVISPNQDDKNDWWAPRLRNQPDVDITPLFGTYDLQIRDRWGRLVFEGNAGRIWRPTGVTAGVYFFTLRYAIDCGEEEEYTREGTIQIVE